MRIEIDPDLCSGHGRCYMAAAQLIDADEQGRGTVLVADVPPELEATARLAAANCPERAVRIG